MKIIKNKNGTYSLQKEDGTLFNYKGQTVFNFFWGHNDESIGIRLGDEKWILVEKDGTIFEHNGQTVFGYIYRYNNGSTGIMDNEKCILVDRKIDKLFNNPEIDNLFNNPSKEFVDKCLQVVFNHYLVAGNIFDKKHCEEIMEREITQDEFDMAQDRASNYYSSGDAYVGLQEFFDEIKEDD